jgi:hypothetical protein
MDAPAAFPAEELARRRQASRRLAWLLAAVVLTLYVVGFFIQRT